MCGQAVGKTDDTLLDQRRIETAVLAVFLLQVAGGAEYTTENAHVFTETQHPLVGGHGSVEGVVDGLEHIHLGHLTHLLLLVLRFSDIRPDAGGCAP